MLKRSLSRATIIWTVSIAIILIIALTIAIIVLTKEPSPEVIPEPLETSKNQNASETTQKTLNPSCLALSCPAGANYVGSKNSDLYYPCSCHYAKRIKPENIVCWKTESEAKEEGRERSEC